MEEFENTGGQEALLSVEEHAAMQDIPASVFAAVMQAQNWAEGKKVSEQEFKEALNAFLNGAMSGFKRRQYGIA